MIETSASVHWQGPGTKGPGQISPETGAHQAVQRGLGGALRDAQGAAWSDPRAMTAQIPLPLGNDGPEISAEVGEEAGAGTDLPVSGIEAVARSRLLTVTADTPLVEVAARLSSAQIGVVVVCDAEGVAIGTITETVLVRHLGLGQANLFTTRAGEVMTQEITTCAPQDLLSDVLATMHARGLVHVLLVGIDRQPLGVLTARDGLRALRAAGNHEEALLRNYVMGIGYQ